MMNWLQAWFGTPNFIPHGFCLQWRPDLLALHGISDGLIAFSYFTIPLILVVFVRRRVDLQYKGVFVLFALFIMACGASHLAGLITLWHPYYELQGFIKLLTALVSMATVFTLWRILPDILALPGPADLRQANARLQAEISAHQRTLGDLQSAHDLLEQRVQERTRALARLNEQLAANEAQLRQVIDAVPIMLAYVGRDRRLGFVNAAYTDYFGRSFLELVGEPLPSLFAAAEVEPFEAAIDAVLAGEATRLEHADERHDLPRLFDTLLTPDRRSDGQIAGFFSASIDITERRELDERRLQGQKLESLGQLTGNIAHDINNLLAVIRGNLDLLRLGSRDDGQTLINDSLTAVDDGAKLLQSLLAYARRQPLSIKRTGLNALLENLARLTRGLLPEHTQLALALDAADVAVEVDANRLEAALLNIAINAHQAMPKGGVLRITAQRVMKERIQGPLALLDTSQEYVQITISDTGVGMDEETLQRCLEPFYTTRERGGGTGLGLSSAYGFFRQSGGDLRIASALGEGTTVSVLLPAYPLLPAIAAERDKGSDRPPRGEGRHVLIVEDRADLRRTIARNLRSLGYHVDVAPDGERALELLQELSSIQLVFSDIILSNALSGFDVRDWVGRHRPHVKVMLTTGYSPAELEASGRGIGATPLLRKPYSIEELAFALDGLMQSPAVALYRGAKGS